MLPSRWKTAKRANANGKPCTSENIHYHRQLVRKITGAKFKIQKKRSFSQGYPDFPLHFQSHKSYCPRMNLDDLLSSPSCLDFGRGGGTSRLRNFGWWWMFNTPHHELLKPRAISSAVRCFRTPGFLKLFTIVSGRLHFFLLLSFSSRATRGSIFNHHHHHCGCHRLPKSKVAFTVYPKAKERLVICFWAT